MHDQTNNIIRAHKKFKGTKLEENNNIATTMLQYCTYNNRKKYILTIEYNNRIKNMLINNRK